MNWLQKLFSKKKKVNRNYSTWNDCPERGSTSYDNPIYNQYANENPEGNDSSFDSSVNHNTSFGGGDFGGGGSSGSWDSGSSSDSSSSSSDSSSSSSD